MTWWDRLFKRKAKPPIAGQEFRVAFSLYSADGKREAEVRDFGGGQVYLFERERVEGTTFKDRHDGRMVGPFASPQEAERFIVATKWFCGPDQ